MQILSSFDFKLLPGAELFLPIMSVQQSKICGNILLQTPPAPPTNMPQDHFISWMYQLNWPLEGPQSLSDSQWPASPGQGCSLIGAKAGPGRDVVASHQR